jgi:hypothetical protein
MTTMLLLIYNENETLGLLIPQKRGCYHEVPSAGILETYCEGWGQYNTVHDHLLMASEKLLIKNIGLEPLYYNLCGASSIELTES